VRAECLDHLFIFNETGLRRVMASYVSYFNHWRPHRSLGQRAPRDSAVPTSRGTGSKIIAESISADCITSIGVRHNARYFCALHVGKIGMFDQQDLQACPTCSLGEHEGDVFPHRLHILVHFPALNLCFVLVLALSREVGTAYLIEDQTSGAGEFEISKKC
jgi:hypothetical protein